MRHTLWLGWVVVATACGRIGIGGDPPVDALIDELCTAGAADADGNGVPDACDACLGASAPVDCATHGVPSGGMPNHAERVTLIGTNAVRADPVGYKDRYMTFADASGANVFNPAPAPVGLLYYRRTGNQAARFHADDRVACATPPADLTELCDGTPFATWVMPYAPVTNAYWYHLGPVAWLAELPIRINSAMVCGGPIDGTLASLSCGGGLHVLDPAQRQLGTGEAYDGVDYTFWPFLFTDTPPAFAFPAVTGGHFIYGSEIHFMLNVESAVAPAAVILVVDGVRVTAPLGLGTPTRGAYRIVEPAGNACRSFYFMLVAAPGVIWRYPGSGQLRTTGEGGCLEEWIP